MEKNMPNKISDPYQYRAHVLDSFLSIFVMDSHNNTSFLKHRYPSSFITGIKRESAIFCYQC